MSDFLTKKEFEAWQKNQKSPSQLLSYLLLAQGGNFKVPLIIFGTFNAGSSAITFTRAFKSGTVPTVVAITTSVYCFCTITSLSNTGVTIRSMSAETLTQTSSNVYWVAIGESS